MQLFSSIVIYTSLFIGLYFQIFLLISFFESDEVHSKADPSDNTLPSVTIAVPCFNEAKTLEKTVRSLLALNYPKDRLSIVIVDDGSKDNTHEIANYLASTDTRVSSVRQTNSGKFTALNHAIKASTSDLFGCLDADSEVDSEALIRMVPIFRDPHVGAVTPAIKVTNPRNLLQHVQKVEYNIGVFTKHILAKVGATYVTPGPFSIFRKNIFDKIGHFRHAHNTEDMEIALRIQHDGFVIKNCSNAYVYTITPPTLKKLHRQRTRWTYGFIRNLIDYRHMLFNPKNPAISILVLPFSGISLVFIMLLISISIYNFGIHIADAAERISIMGFDWHAPTLDWFFMSNNVNVLVVPFLLTISITILLIGKKMSGDKARLSWDMLAFFPVYAIITPIWVGKALWNVALAKSTPWR